MPEAHRRLLFCAFALSGFSGLIYESLWTHYLKLFLGHAAYAQTLVLAIFMGGLALGSWICSRRSHRWTNLLAGYALAEGVVGAAALVSHPTFTAAVDATYSHLVPALGSAGLVTAVKWALGAALILPQSILLGMTFPLMAGGMIRVFPERPGASLALLYFCNSAGAVCGVLASGFFFIPHLGLPGTGIVAGSLNVLVALLVWRLAGRLPQPRPPLVEPVPASSPEQSVAPAQYSLLLTVSLLTGASSFVYEVGWIRMLSLVLGSSTQAFELMLSAFILGLALGGLWIRRRIDRLNDAVQYLGWMQVAMGLLAVATLPVYEWTLPVMRSLVNTLPKTDAGYLQFNLASHAIASAVMVPAAFFAGTTLPLITYAVLRSPRGEAGIGAVYGANTLGAIAGIAAAVHVGLPILGLKLLIVAGAAIDVALGVLLLSTARAQQRSGPVFATVLGAAVLGLVIFAFELDTRLMATGVFRPSQDVLTNDVNVLFNRDGKTATVHVTARGAAMSIRTNGKVDATVMMSPDLPPASDEPTQVLSAALPLILHPEARTAANIGLGSGMTTHVLLGMPELRVDTIEIEHAMIEGAREFRPRNERAYTDPRSRIVVDDAKTFFSTERQLYDIIVSEPSNPWVSGTASLFSTEFYALVRQHLRRDGVFVQWLQLYEFNLDLVASVLKAIGQHFDDYALYEPVRSDILIVATSGRTVPAPQADLLANGTVAEELRRIGVRSLADVAIRRIADRKLLEPWLQTQSIAPNSDFRPVLYHRAARARFLNQDAGVLTMLVRGPLPVLELLQGDTRVWASAEVTPGRLFSPAYEITVAKAVRDLLLAGSGPPRDPPGEVLERTPDQVARALVRRCHAAEADRRPAVYALGGYLAGHLPASELPPVWDALARLPCGSNLTAAEESWVALIRSVGARDARGMGAAAERVLSISGDDPERRSYAVAAGMLGHLAADAPDAARRLWQQSQPVEAGAFSFVLSVLRAHARVSVTAR